MNEKLRGIARVFIFAMGIFIFAGSAMAFDLGGMLKQVEKAAQQMGVDQNTSAQPSNRQAVQGSQISAQGSISPSDSPRNAEEYCQRISTNPSIIQLAEEIRKTGEDNTNLEHTYLDNNNGDLSKWVADNFRKMANSPPHTAQTGILFFDRRPIKEKFDWVASCYRNTKGTNNPFNIVANPGDHIFLRDDVGALDKSLQRGSSYFDHREVTLLAFLFPGAEDVISRTSPEVGASLRKAANEKMERNKQAEIGEDKKHYGGLRAVYAFRTNPAIAASYNKCLSGEREFRSKKASEIEANAKNANTVAEQNKMNETASRIRRNIEYIAHGNCIYRLNVGLLILEGSDEMAAVAAGYNMGGREEEDLNAKYVPAALKKAAGLMELPAEKFEDTKVVKPFTEARDELDKLKPANRRQQEEIEAQKMMLNLLQINIVTGINDIVTSLIEGKVQ